MRKFAGPATQYQDSHYMGDEDGDGIDYQEGRER